MPHVDAPPGGCPTGTPPGIPGVPWWGGGQVIKLGRMHVKSPPRSACKPTLHPMVSALGVKFLSCNSTTIEYVQYPDQVRGRAQIKYVVVLLLGTTGGVRLVRRFRVRADQCLRLA